MNVAARRIASFVLLILICAGSACTAAPDSARLIKLDPLAPHVAGQHCYRVHVESGGDPLLILLRGDVSLASLAIDGRLERVGRRIPTGFAPLGQSVPSFAVAAAARLGPLCVEGGGVRIEAIVDSSVLREAVFTGRLSGIYYGIFSAISLLIVGSLVIAFESVSLFYLLFMLTFLGFEALRTGAMPFGQALNSAQCFLLLNVITAFAATGFFVEFLRLRENPRLCRIVVLGIGLESAIGMAFVFIPALAPMLDDLNLGLNVVGTTLLIVVAVARGRQGYRPAYSLLTGLSGLMLANWYLALRDFVTFSTPTIDYWAFEAGTATDAILFSIAIAYRRRYDVSEAMRVKRELERATFAAEHDALTGLANRRGLERWIASALPTERTLVYIDLDHFKLVNDRGGHEAGDQTLIAVAAILERLMRATDIAARVGGDEFVLVVAATAPTRIAALKLEIETQVSALRPLGSTDPLRIGASVGTAPVGPPNSFSVALQLADGAAYSEKRAHHRTVPAGRPR